MTNRLQVLVAEDNRLVRMGIVAWLRLHDDIEVVGEAGDGAQAVTMTRALAPQVLLLDLRMPVLDGVEVIVQVMRDGPATKILVLSHYDGEEDVFRAVTAGARGYLNKDCNPEEILKALRSVAGGGRHMGAQILDRLSDRLTHPELTRREMQVLEGISRGQTNRQIASELGISEKTCAFHVGSLMGKIGAQSRTEALALALKRGLLPPQG